VAKWNPLALKILMWLMGILLVAGSASGYIGASFFAFDKWFGVTGSMAGVAFGAGVMIAGFNPEGNVSWVRAVILYCILEIIYEIVNQITLGRFDLIAFVIAIIVGVLLLVLYPNKSALMMSGGTAKAK
jgi:hypothetical protein